MLPPSVIIAAPLTAAGLLVIVGTKVERRVVQWASIAIASIVLGLTILMLRDVLVHGTRVEWVGGWHPGNRVGLGIALGVDLASACIAALVATTMLAAIVFAYQYFDDVVATFYALLFAMLGAMIGFSYSADAFNIFVWYEVFSVAAYALATFNSEAESAYAGALQFALTNSAAGLFFLIGITLLEARTGQLGLVPIGHALAAEHRVDALLVVAFSFVTVGLLTRGALVPLQFWFDEVQAAAPAPLSAIVAGSMTPLALYAFARIYWTVFARVLPPNHALVALTVGIGTLSALYGSLMCLHESRLKRKLAHASVAHAGVALALIGEYTPRALAAAATYAATYAAALASLFFAVAILRNVAHEYDAKLLRGVGRRLTFTRIAFGLAILGLVALGANVRIAATGGTAHAGVAVTILVAGTTLATGGAFVALFVRIFLMAPRTARIETGSPPWFLLTSTMGLALVSVAMSASPQVAELAARAAELVTASDAYGRAVMLAPVTAHPDVPVLHVGLQTLLLPLGALVIAACILTRARLVRILRVTAMRGAIFRFAYAINCGDAGAYIAYVAASAAILAALLARCYRIAR